MQTFLPDFSFVRSAKILDDKRLGKQRVEVLQIAHNLLGYSDGWTHHPAVKMWRGYESPLLAYGIDVCDEWRRRGFKDTVREKLMNLFFLHGNVWTSVPEWLTQDFIDAHRSNLLRKDPEFYGKYGWDVPGDLPYIWPR